MINEYLPIIQYFLSGFAGAFVMTLFIALNEDRLGLPIKNRLTSLKDYVRILFLAYSSAINGAVGGLLAIAVDGSITNAIITGMFSQFIIVLLVKWILTRSLRLALDQLLGGIIKDILGRFGFELVKNHEINEKDKK